MKKYIGLLALVSILFCCTAQNKQFSSEALQTNLTTFDNQTIIFKEILDKYKGKTVLIDVWASWCPDCIKGMPTVKSLQKEHPEVTFLFLSVDKSYESWITGIERFEVEGEHYFIPDGMKGVFGKAINLSWIPRYILVDTSGNVAYYNATEITDTKLLETLKKIK